MVLVRFVSVDGEETDLQIDAGMTVMEGAVRNGVEGIDADCGGQLACATCHVYIGSDWFDRLPPMSSGERDLLDYAPELKETSRLSCQVSVSEELDGLVVQIPSSQAG